MKTSYHNHTVFSDGQATPEETVRAAVGMGMTEIGISDHAYSPIVPSWSIDKNRQEEYIAEILRLKAAYADKISVKCGLEMDLTSPLPPEGVEYLIGSVHLVSHADGWLQLDHSQEMLQDGIDRFFGGNSDRLAEIYFDEVAQYADRPEIAVIGHFDLITKYNEQSPVVRRTAAYTAAWKKAAAKLADAGKIFEINTGAISRGYRTSPYPDDEMIAFLAGRGVKFLLSADAHKPEHLLFAFDDARKRAEAAGAQILDRLP